VRISSAAVTLWLKIPKQTSAGCGQRGHSRSESEHFRLHARSGPMCYNVLSAASGPFLANYLQWRTIWSMTMCYCNCTL
jgi:hypothetical protein